ncbi:MAG TPA: hypothetical protein VHD33_06755 [Legionellaceae bacterium]|nr:hypothetical protein [Legionellaceae bacterium]
MKFNNSDTDEFREFAKSLKLMSKQRDKENWQEVQTTQLTTLLTLEEEFRKNLINTHLGARIYMEFINYITFEKRNILTARPYFRERQKVFSDNISDAIRDQIIEEIFKYHINFQFISFVNKRAKLYPGSTLAKLYKQIKDVRQDLVETNMPLAISRARVFYSRTPKSHLSYLDLIELAAMGLLHGVDKYSPGDGPISTKVFRSTIIGVMSSVFMEHYSQTILHFYPQDKRKLYRANKAVGKFGPLIDYEEIAKVVNSGVGVMDGNDFIKDPTDASEIADLMAAASTVSSDSIVNKDSSGFEDLPEPVNKFQAPDSCRPDVQLEEKNNLKILMEAMDKLTIFERKLMRLLGIRGDLVYTLIGAEPQ